MIERKEANMQACLTYFRERPVYHKLFQKLRDKYASLGHLGGTVRLSNLTLEEKSQLGGFLQKDFRDMDTVTVSAALLKKALADSRFSALEWEAILEGYFGEALYVKKDLARTAQQKQKAFFDQILAKAQDERAAGWLKQVLEERLEGYQLLIQQYQQDPKRLETILKNVLHTIPRLPAFSESAERLAVFAADMTGDPHYYDDGTIGERLLSAFLTFYFGMQEGGGLSRAERKSRLLYQAGILKDDLSNYVLTVGLRGEDRNGHLHEGLEGFFKRKEPVHLSLLTLGRLKSVWASREKKVVYVVENPAVFSALTEDNRNLALVCTNGQPRLAALVLLDLLVERHLLYYAGDFDPEGLVIAQNLKRRYGEKMRLWNYKREYYERCVSEVVLSEPRLKKLDKVQEPELEPIKLALLQTKRAAYQEKLLVDTKFLQSVD